MEFTSELQMEKNLIKQLTEGTSQWTYRPDLKTEEDLWNNFKNILEFNNVATLDEVPITRQEFQQIKNQLNFANFYDAAVFLRGENGKSKVSVQREDATLGTVHLDVINSREIAGGSSVYEVINQFQSLKDGLKDRDRRFDVSLLINGLPLIHIELKSRRTGYMDAFRQIKKYLREGKFTGIYSLVQMFVVSNGTDTRYIAAASDTKLNEKFLTRWVDKDNKLVSNYLDFARDVLSIPEAHQMVTQYCVLDKDKKSIILLRPYQIHAIKAVKKATTRQKSGYVWHTTGSGKTLTSYQVARNLLQIPSLDKTIFIVDRVALDQQTTASFLSYAENDIIEIDETDNVFDLVNKLASKDRTVIVTTIQKLNVVMKIYNKKKDGAKYKRLHSLKVAFVVDECHRAVTPQTQDLLKKFFPNSLWYGFTGTPIFGENARDAFGNLPRTTKEQYGESLHDYTVREAIGDEAVLGFQVEYKSTFSDDKLNNTLSETYPDKDIYNMEPIEKEKLIPIEAFEKDEHRLEVIDSIINKSQTKLGLHKGPGKSYGAMLTVSSIPEAQRYYELFKEVKAERSSVTIGNDVKSKIHDFPKVAITYSLTENKELSQEYDEKMSEAIEDYNKMFNSSFNLETVNSYNNDLNNRLARKHDRFLTRKEQIDIVIVVDRLLTGFDAPSLSTLFIDRPPLRPHHIIQAFSRTNRLYDRDKMYGQIVTFQTPNIWNQKADEAFKLYSRGGQDDVLAPSFEEALEELKNAIKELTSIAPNPDSVDGITNLEGMKKFAKAFQDFDKAYASIQVYSEFEKDKFEEDHKLTSKIIEDYKGKYENVIERIKEENGDKDDEDITFDIEYELQSVSKDTIDYEYLTMLIQTHVKNDNEPNPEPPADKEEIESILSEFEKTRPEYAYEVRKVWEDLQADGEKYRNKNISAVIQSRIDEHVDSYISEFSDKYFVSEDNLYFVAKHYNSDKESGKQLGESALINSADYETYKKHAENPLPKIKYRSQVRKGFKELIEEKILPYRWDE